MHNKIDVPLATTFIYLESLLYDDATSLVEHITQESDQNYNAVWTLLNDRNENKRILFTNALNASLNLPIMDGRSKNILRKYIRTIYQ